LPSEFIESPDDVGLLHATYNHQRPVTLGDDYELASLRGWGHVVAMNLWADEPMGDPHSAKIMLQEGNIKYRVDGFRSLTVSCTGLEDYFGMGHGFPPLRSWHSGPSGLAAVGGVDHLTEWHNRGRLPNTTIGERDMQSRLFIQGYRQHLADFIPFERQLYVSVEHGSDYGEVNTRMWGDFDTPTPEWKQNHIIANMESVLLWYGRAGAVGNRQTDSVEPLNAADASSHSYNYTWSENQQAEEETCEGYFYGTFATPLWVMHSFPCRIYSAPGAVIVFSVAVDPGNVGVILRRRVRHWPPHQAALVLVDDQPAGVWWDAGCSALDLNMLDSEIHIPAPLTRKKSRLAIKLRVLTTWCESSYQTFSVI